MEPEVRIDVIDADEAGELLTVRRAAFVDEAQQYGDPHIPALTQTLEELREDLRRIDVVTLGAWIGPRLVGSIRVEVEGPRATLGRLAVVPDLQGKGIGTQLLLAIPPYLPPETSEVWVFTARDSVHNLADAYEDESLGDLTYAYLQRILGESAAAGGLGQGAPADTAADDAVTTSADGAATTSADGDAASDA